MKESAPSPHRPAAPWTPGWKRLPCEAQGWRYSFRNAHFGRCRRCWNHVLSTATHKSAQLGSLRECKDLTCEVI